MGSRAWPSLSDHLALAGELFDDRGPRLVDDWLAEQVARIDDPEFARTFSDHVALPGVAARDFNHREVRTSRGSLVGGIRFRGRDVTRPFVEVCCHGFDDLDALRDCVRSEWSGFVPRALRLHTRPGRITAPEAILDQGVHLARYRDMPAPDGRVTLAPFDRIEDVLAIVNRRYDAIAIDDPALARNVTREDADDLRRLHADGHLLAVLADDRIVGALAAAPGAIAWLPGDEINEEVIDVAHGGQGYAASAQRFWARHVASDPDRHLIGTVDRLNDASRRTAQRAGRPAVLTSMFLPLSVSWPPEPLRGDRDGEHRQSGGG